jgi:hypothetical protein
MMVAKAVYSSYQDNAANLMRPLREASELLVENSRAQKARRLNNKSQQPAFNPEKRQKLVEGFAGAMRALDSAEEAVLYYTQEELDKRLEELTLVMNVAGTLKNLGEALLLKTQMQSTTPAKPSMVEEVHKMFTRFFERLSEVVELVHHLATTPEPDEDSAEFAAFLGNLSKAV